MDIEQFNPSQRKNLTKTIGGGWAYVPPPLPPKIDLGPVALKLASAAIAVGELNGAARRLQNPSMLIMPLIRKEALTSSAIEGTITTINNMLLEQVSPKANGDENAREAFNYVVAITKANNLRKTLPISHRVIKEAHAILLSGMSHARGAGKKPGEYKSSQNAIGKTGDTETTARYVPAPPAETQKCMDQLEAFINRTDRAKGEELIDLAIMHYQFEAIHPFNDGNGRIGRMLVTLMAQDMKLVDQPLLHISANLENKKDEYIDKLFAVSTNEDWIGWIGFFLDVVKESCSAATQVVDKIINLQTEYKQRAFQNKGNHRLSTIIDSLFVTEWTTVGDAQKLCGVTFPTAQADLQELVALKILEQIANTRPAIHVAREILNLSSRN